MPRVVLCLLLATACGSGERAADAPATPPPDQVTGLIIQTHFEGDRLVRFEVETVADTYEVLIDPELDYGFNLRHLEVHQKQELPVLVDLEVRGDDLYAVSVLDA